MKLKRSNTNRGFKLIEFADRYDAKCSLQESSLVTEAAIWLGVADPAPKVMARDAVALGIKTDETTGWVDYPLPKEVLVTTRMHLTQRQVEALLPILQRFVETGEL